MEFVGWALLHEDPAAGDGRVLVRFAMARSAVIEFHKQLGDQLEGDAS